MLLGISLTQVVNILFLQSKSLGDLVRLQLLLELGFSNKVSHSLQYQDRTDKILKADMTVVKIEQ